MKLDDFDYHLPDALIAQTPAEQRDASRMLVLHRDKSGYDDQMFSAFPKFLKAGDCLVEKLRRFFFPCAMMAAGPLY